MRAVRLLLLRLRLRQLQFGMSKVESINYTQDAFLGGICEAVAASWFNELCAASEETVYWYGGNTKILDIEVGDYSVDVKRAFVQQANWKGQGSVQCLGFMGTKRDLEAREGVSHYFLVVPTESPWVELRGGRVSITYESPVRMFLVPRDDINRHFHRDHIIGTGLEGKGLNRYFPLEAASRWEVRFKTSDG